MRGKRKLEHRCAGGAHPRDVAAQSGKGLGIDHRTDVGVEPARVAEGELGHRALEHREHALGDVGLQAEDAQCRAALAGAIERGADGVGDDLLG